MPIEKARFILYGLSLILLGAAVIGNVVLWNVPDPEIARIVALAGVLPLVVGFVVTVGAK